MSLILRQSGMDVIWITPTSASTQFKVSPNKKSPMERSVSEQKG